MFVWNKERLLRTYLFPEDNNGIGTSGGNRYADLEDDVVG